MRISDWSSDVCSSDLESRARSGAAVRGVQARLHPHQPSSEIQWSAACSLLRNMPRMGLAAPIKNIVYLERSRPIACNGEAAKISKSGQPPSTTLPDPGTLFNEGRPAFPSLFGHTGRATCRERVCHY